MARAELPMERVRGEAGEPSDVTYETWLLRKLSARLKGLGKFITPTEATKVR